MSTSKTDTDEDLKLKKTTNSNSSNKPCVVKTFESILEKKGYKILNTIGNGSYAKVKLVCFLFVRHFFLQQISHQNFSFQKNSRTQIKNYWRKTKTSSQNNRSNKSARRFSKQISSKRTRNIH